MAVNLIYRAKRGKHFGVGCLSGALVVTKDIFLSIWPGVEFVSPGNDGT